MTVILGIDPGSRKTGFGLISVDRNKPHYVSSGTIHLPSKEPLSVRLKVLFESLTEVIDTYQPQVAAIERVFITQATIAAPLACPSFSAESALFATKTRSIDAT